MGKAKGAPTSDRVLSSGVPFPYESVPAGVQLTPPPLPVQRETRRPGSSRLLSCQERTLLLRHHQHILSVQRAVSRLRQELQATAQLLQVGTHPGLQAPLWAGGACRQGLCGMCKALVQTSWDDRSSGYRWRAGGGYFLGGPRRSPGQGGPGQALEEETNPCGPGRGLEAGRSTWPGAPWSGPAHRGP